MVEDEVEAAITLEDFLTDEGFKVSIAHNGREGLEVYHAEHPDIVITDVRMPGMNGFSGISEFHTSHPDVPIVILSGHFNREDVIAALDHGVSGYIPKNIGGMAMVNALRLVLAGEKYLPSEAFSESTTSEAPSISSEIRTQQQAQQANPAFSSLTQRESEILRLLVDGLTNKQIAINLGLQEITVKIHVRNVYRKIDAKNRARAVKLTIESGWLNA